MTIQEIQARIMLTTAKLIVIFIIACFTVDALAHGNHHGSTTVNNYYSQETIQKHVNQATKGFAIAGASGQHHYKATTALQWSVAGAYTDVTDTSAISFGLGKQYESVFLSVSYSTDGESTMVTGAASGVF